MALPAFQFRTPTENDPIVNYAIGSRLGLDASAGNWVARNGEWPYVRSSPHAYLYDNVTQGRAIEEGASILQWANPISRNHWCACQSVIPIGAGTGGWCTGVRVSASANSGYFLQCVWVQDYENGNTVWSLTRRAAGVDSLLWSLVDYTDSDSTQFGLTYTDGMFLILEVAGTNPVEIRAVVAPCRQRGGGFQNSYTLYPTDVPISSGSYNPGGPAYRVLCEVSDSSASRLTTGQPGMGVVGSGAPSVSDAMYNFNAGDMPILSATADPVVGGTTTVRVARPPGTTVTVTEI